MPDVPEPAYWLDGGRFPLAEWPDRWLALMETAPPGDLERLYTDPRHVEARRQVREDCRFAQPVMDALVRAAVAAECRSGVPLRALRRRR